MKILTLGPAIVDMFMYTNEFISRGGDIRINKMDFGVGGSIISEDYTLEESLPTGYRIVVVTGVAETP